MSDKETVKFGIYEISKQKYNLILKLVKSNPILFDPTHPQYKDNYKKYKTWKTVSKFTGEKSEQIWKEILSNYLKKIMTDTCENDTDEKLNFLFPHIENLIKKSYQKSCKEVFDMTTCPDEQNNISIDDDFIDYMKNSDRICLIEEIQSHPILYNMDLQKIMRSRKEYSETLAWETISKNVKYSVKRCQYEWECLQKIYYDIYIKKSENLTSKNSEIYEDRKNVIYMLYFAMDFINQKFLQEPNESINNDNDDSENLNLIQKFFMDVEEKTNKLPSHQRIIIEKEIQALIDKTEFTDNLHVNVTDKRKTYNKKIRLMTNDEAATVVKDIGEEINSDKNNEKENEIPFDENDDITEIVNNDDQIIVIDSD